MRMFKVAKDKVDPKYVPDLVRGVNAFVARVNRQASEGRVIPMNYMDPQVRYEIFLVESFMHGDGSVD
jgi:hypothetical protein